MAEFMAPQPREGKRQLVTRPLLDKCSIGHAEVFYLKSATCPMCAIKGYISTIAKKIEDAQTMIDYLNSVVFGVK